MCTHGQTYACADACVNATHMCAQKHLQAHVFLDVLLRTHICGHIYTRAPRQEGISFDISSTNQPNTIRKQLSRPSNNSRTIRQAREQLANNSRIHQQASDQHANNSLTTRQAHEQLANNLRMTLHVREQFANNSRTTRQAH